MPETPTAETKREIATKLHTALRTRDWELFRSILTADAVWTLPGTSLISGEAVGAEAVVKRAQLITSYGLNFGLKHILYGQYGFALSLNNTAQRQDQILDEHLATVCSLQNGKIVRIDTYLSDVDMADAFFVPI
jgi:hypothetical protein